MTCVEDVTHASNPQQALLAIAKHIDRLSDQLEDLRPADDGWGQWAVPEEGKVYTTAELAQFDPRFAFEPVNHAVATERITEIKEELRTAEGQDADALRAELRLLEDPGSLAPVAVPDGQRAAIGEDEVVLPAVTPQQQAERYAWAMRNQLSAYLEGFTAEQAADQFAKGGPMWLYLGNRDAVMAMTEQARVELVQDVELQSPAQARELARDILKSTESASETVATTRDKQSWA